MRTAITFVAICTAAAFLTACQAKERGAAPTAEAGAETAERTAPSPTTVTFTTSDGWKIYASYWEAGEGNPAAILLHMLIADRGSYDEFGAKLAEAGFNVLALDSRGHGDSTQQNGETKRYADFDDAAHKSSLLDIAAAKDFLAQKGAETSKLVIVGASIGANFALNYGADDADVSAVVLLSPGLSYHGVDTAAAMAKYRGRPAYLVASAEDKYSADSVGKLHEIDAGAELKIFEDAGHGTKIFAAEPPFEDELVTWLASRVK
jgi:alpha-beta hydrolase superfamily lysophospholipase